MQLSDEYESEGVVVVEVVQTAVSAAALQAWSLGHDYNLMRTEPANQMETDYATDQQFLGYPTFPLIDADTMTVLNADCYMATPQYLGYETMTACVEQYL